MDRKNLCCVCGIVLWAAALLLLGFAVWAFVHSAGVISQAKAAGQLSGSGAGFVIVNFYMSNSLVYVVYALLLAALGLLLRKKEGVVNVIGRAKDKIEDRKEDCPASARYDDGDRERGDRLERAEEPELPTEPTERE